MSESQTTAVSTGLASIGCNTQKYKVSPLMIPCLILLAIAIDYIISDKARHQSIIYVGIIFEHNRYLKISSIMLA